MWDSDTGFVFESEHNTGRYDTETVLRLFQRVLLVPAANTGNAYWRELKLQ